MEAQSNTPALNLFCETHKTIHRSVPGAHSECGGELVCLKEPYISGCTTKMIMHNRQLEQFEVQKIWMSPFMKRSLLACEVTWECALVSQTDTEHPNPLFLEFVDVCKSKAYQC